MANKIITLPVRLELTEEQSGEFDEIKRRLGELNDDGHIGLCIAQVYFENGRTVLGAGLIENDERAEAICLAAGQTKKALDDARKRAKRYAIARAVDRASVQNDQPA